MFERNGFGDIPNVSYTGGNAVIQKFVFKLRYRVIQIVLWCSLWPYFNAWGASPKKAFSVPNARM